MVNRIPRDETIKDIQELLDDLFNYEDTDVGIYSIGVIDEKLVKWFSYHFEGITFVSWEPQSATLNVNGYYIDIRLVPHEVGPNEFEAKWEVIEE